MLGFTLTPGLEPYAPEEGSQAEISAENVDLIDADVIVFATESKAMFDELQDFGTIENLTAVSGNRAVYTDEVLAGAIYFDTPLSLQHVLERADAPARAGHPRRGAAGVPVLITRPSPQEHP